MQMSMGIEKLKKRRMICLIYTSLGGKTKRWIWLMS